MFNPTKITQGLYLLDISSAFYIRAQNRKESLCIKHPLIEEYQFIDTDKHKFLEVGNFLKIKSGRVRVLRIIKAITKPCFYHFLVVTASYGYRPKGKRILRDLQRYLDDNNKE